MHKIVKMGLSVSAAFMMNISLAFGMEEDTFPVTVPSKLNKSPQTLSPVDFEGRISKDVRHLIVKQASYEQCLENKSPVNLALVCKEWRGIIVDDMQVGQPSWKAWYGVIGHEDIYERFLKGVLVYRPTEGSDVGKIELPIAALTNPLGSPFDLSKCGDTGQYLSIATGYRKGKKTENAKKVEIWLAPRFLIEKELQGKAWHFAPIMSAWDVQKAPIGLFFNRGEWIDLRHYDYLTSLDWDSITSENLYKKWHANHTACTWSCRKYRQTTAIRIFHLYGKATASGFHVSFMN